MAFLSGLTGYIGMTLATQGNVRTAAAAKRNSMPAALKVAFRTGGVAGMFTVGLGLLGATVIIAMFQNTSSAILVGFGFGGSLLALFLRVGGGIFTKAADVGADLVGKVEAGIPEDDPRNPATIADNVGDNVGDCAGMASDLFESYEVTLVASIILGVPAFEAAGAQPGARPRVPARRSRHRRDRLHRRRVRREGQGGRDRRPQADQPRLPHRRHHHRHRRRRPRPSATSATRRASPATAPSPSPTSAGAASAPSSSAWCSRRCVSRLTEYFTATHHGPVKEIAEPPAPVPPPRSCRAPRPAWRARCTPSSPSPSPSASLGLGGGNLQFSLYLVALCGMGMLATTGVIVSEDTFGPVSDNAAGIAEMSGEFHGEPERIMVSLDAVGNTTKAVTKGFAIGSAVIASVAIFASFIETAVDEIVRPARSPTLLDEHQPRRVRPAPDQRRRSEGLHRPAHRRLDAVPLLGPRHQRRVPHGRRRRAGGASPVRRRPDHGRREAARPRSGDRHLHRGLAPRARHPGPARRAHAR